MRYVAYGKYVSYVKDYTSVVAGDLFFKSSTLSVDGTTNRVPVSLDKEITIELDNYENSLVYNEDGDDIYYYVEAELYDTDDYQIREASDEITAISYTKEIIYGIKKNPGGTEEKNTDVVGDWVVKKGDSISKTSIAALYGHENGFSTTDDQGRNFVYIRLKTPKAGTPEKMFLVVTATALSLSDTSNGNYIKLYDSYDDQTGETIPGEKLTDVGSFKIELKGLYELSNVAEGVDYNAYISRQAGGETKVLYTIACNKITGAGDSAQFRMIFDTSKLTLSLSADYDMPQPISITGSAIETYQYVDVDQAAPSSIAYTFYKVDRSDTIQEGSILEDPDSHELIWNGIKDIATYRLEE